MTAALVVIKITLNHFSESQSANAPPQASLISRPRILMTCLFFFWYVTDNVRVYMNSVHDPLDTELYIYGSYFGHFL
jgi:hypothetical protein